MVNHATPYTRIQYRKDRIDYNWKKDDAPPSFHKRQSLGERLYREQSIDTRALLGHGPKAITDYYNDTREKEWKKLAI
jgi:hypothetical protein